MPVSIEFILLWVSVLILISIFSSKLSDKFAVPALLLFLIIGMLAGFEGPGGIYFDDPYLAKTIGIIALIFIIFSGGLDTSWKEIRPVALPGFFLATAGVFLTAFIVGVFSVFILKFSLLEGLLLGAIVSSTDAAAVFSVLRSRHISLKSPLKPMLELESGSNDPMAVFLTLSFISMLTVKNIGVIALTSRFVLDMGGGALVGYAMAKMSVWLIGRLKLEYDGLYPVLTVSLVLLTYSLAALLQCNGFLAVFLVGLIMGKHEFLNKKMIMRFHDGLAWLMQIVMFLTLGLLVFPSHLLPVMGAGLLIAIVLMVLARPVSVLMCLLPFPMVLRKKIMVAWVGLRGAAPIVLATFPLLAGIPQADTIFNVVFFVVLTSVLIQGTSIPLVSRILNVDAPMANKRRYPIEFEKIEGIDAELTDLIVPYVSEAVGKQLMELNMPGKCLIVLISRGDRYIIPAGQTVIEGGDVLLVLANEHDLAALQKKLASLREEDNA
ncbi:K+/H+ antiporter [Candidatus Velamenicoccus archaeovorus]|uniref:K+/H+ antiporter n=1 Tax=Velamenicoccus archaeovorus TaxID=1930593 RepID=A0A410P3J2_VELA1|nr:potassium/proton antiporter [Candidatus Velamenicoccus archaeovorus]QAT16648.1 K+/H+ antiporter [Candidatus Velamenicoccus archaeovorus]